MKPDIVSHTPVAVFSTPGGLYGPWMTVVDDRWVTYFDVRFRPHGGDELSDNDETYPNGSQYVPRVAFADLPKKFQKVIQQWINNYEASCPSGSCEVVYKTGGTIHPVWVGSGIVSLKNPKGGEYGSKVTASVFLESDVEADGKMVPVGLVVRLFDTEKSEDEGDILASYDCLPTSEGIVEAESILKNWGWKVKIVFTPEIEKAIMEAA